MHTRNHFPSGLSGKRPALVARLLSARGLALAALLSGAIVVLACGGPGPTVDVDGSSTVFRISQLAAEEFRVNNPGIQIPIGISGTGGGFERFTRGETDISNASRPIKDSERAAAAANGVEFIELTVANDGIAVVTHTDTTFVECLTVEQLKATWEPDSDVERWNQVDSSFPDNRLTLYGPDRDSGTFDYFTDEVVGEEGLSRSDYSASSNDNVLVQGVSSQPGTLGYFGFAYYLENRGSLNLIEVDNGDGCVEPSVETIGTGSYAPLSRPLFIYVNRASLEREEVNSFVHYYLDNAATLATGSGYVPLPEADYAIEQAELGG